MIEEWLKRQAQYDLNEHVRSEIQALIKRGNVTPAETAELHCNSWEWEALVPAMDDEAFVARMEHAIANCGQHKRPFSTYNEAVEGLYAPELLRRFKLAAHDAQAFAETLDAIRAALGQKETHYLVMADDVAIAVKALEWYASKTLDESSKRAKLALASIRGRTITTTCEACGKKLIAVEEEAVPATFCRECGGGCTALPPEEVLPDLQDGPRGVCRLPHRAEGQQ
jgi:hypothetical protein